jgi:UTP--glucose-1-phosphate uridylyltransferase
MLRYYGAVGGSRLAGRSGLCQIERALEKPTPTKAEQDLAVAGLRAGQYLCVFGMHVFTPTVMELLDRQVARIDASGDSESLMLSPTQAELAKRERYLAVEMEGTRFNIGVNTGCSSPSWPLPSTAATAKRSWPVWSNFWPHATTPRCNA